MFALVAWGLVSAPPLAQRGFAGGPGQPVLAWTDEMLASDRAIFKGKITLIRRGGFEYKRDRSRDRTIDTSEKSRAILDASELEVCGSWGALFPLQVDRTLTDTERSSTRRQQAEANCGYPPEAKGHGMLYVRKHFEPDIRTPGDWETEESATTIEAFRTATDDNPSDGMHPDPKAKVALLLVGKDRYRLEVAVTLLGSVKRESRSTRARVCSDKKEVTAAVTRTCVSGCTYGVKREGVGTDAVTITTTVPPTLLSIGASAEAGGIGTSLAGRQIVHQVVASEPGELSEQTEMTWALAVEDACAAAMDQLREELAWAEAYSDEQLQARPVPRDPYEEAVTGRAYTIYTGEQPPHGGVAPADGATGPGGDIKHPELIEKRAASACRPRVVAEAILLHERKHGSQLAKTPLPWSNAQLGTFETQAYLVSAQTLVEWIENKCPELTTRSARERMERLRRQP
jgi:hypothetical protein